MRPPYCTQKGMQYCDLRIRENHRNGKSLLTEAQTKRLNPKSDLNEKYGGYIKVSENVKTSQDKSTNLKAGGTIQSSNGQNSL